MTNETTASQPKSIGDDAQFKQAFNLIYDAYSKPATDFVDDSFAYQFMRKKVTEAYSLMQRLRAPAAQASATIQAAPEGTAMQRYKECSGDDEPSALERLRFFCSLALNGRDWLDSEKFFADLAATIQEPVMVAEPVTFDLSKLKRYAQTDSSMEVVEPGTHVCEFFDVDEVRLLLAAPMVADPAGAAFDREEFIRQVSVGIAEMDRDSPEDQPGMMLVTPQELQNVMRNAFGSFDEDAELAGAATVKAVPSEALDEVLRLKFEAEARANWPIGFERNHFGAFSSSSVERDYQTWKIAAPLSDQTGGGE